MVENQKTSQIKLDFLDTLYNLILTEDITDEERRVLTKAKNLVEKGSIFPMLSDVCRQILHWMP